jgi:hypothetical protein
MDSTYRFRFLIYVAAFMLLMSVCFVYAEPIPSQNHLLFQAAPQHSGFLASSFATPTFDPNALRAANPQVPPEVMERLEAASHSHRGLFHRARRTVTQPLLPKAPTQFVLDGAIDSPLSAHHSR